MLRRVMRTSLIYLASGVFIRATGAAVAIILTRFLEPKQYGILAVVSSFTGVLAPLLLLGIDSAPTVYRYTLTPAAYAGFLSGLRRAAVAIPLAVLFLVDGLGRHFGSLAWPAFEWAPYMTLGLGVAGLSVLPGVVSTVFQADQNARAFTVLGVTQSCLWATATFLCVAYVDHTAGSVLRAQLLATLVIWIVSDRVLRQRSSGAPADWVAVLRAMRVYAPVLPHGLCIWLLNLSDRWILGRYASLEVVGVYSVGYSMSMLVQAVGSSQVRAFGPAYVEARSRPGYDQAALDRLATVYAAGPIFLATSLSVFADEILAVLSSEKYAGAAPYVPWVAFAYAIFVAVYQTNLVAIEFHQRMSSLLLISLPAAGLNIVLNLWLVPFYGGIAAAVNTLVAFLYMALASSVIRWRVDGRAPHLRPIGYLLAVAILATIVAASLQSESWSVRVAGKGLLLVVAAFAFLTIAGLLIPLARRAGIKMTPK